MTIAWALWWLACSGDPASVCAQPDGMKPVNGDSNGDGRLDIADPIRVALARERGGADPVCAAALEMNPDGRVELGDAWMLFGYLFDGGTTLGGSADGCAAATAGPEVCVAAGFGFDVPKKATGPTDVHVTALGAGMEAWQLGIEAEGCTISGADVAGTAAARVDEGGQRDMGYEHTEFTATGAASAVAVSWRSVVPLITTDGGTPILTLHLQPGSACAKCTLRMASSSLGGRPFDTAFSSGGRSFLPPVAEATLTLCP
jgi:hypothetical protein